MMLKTAFHEKVASSVQAYEEGVEFFRGCGMLNTTLRRLAREFEQHGIAYSVIGAAALNRHGYRRFVEVIDLLLSSDYRSVKATDARSINARKGLSRHS